MKNLLLLCITALCLYLYFNPSPTAQEQTAAAPAPVSSGPTVYYHSPLDAPAMPAYVSTGSGYYSTDSSTRFGNYQHHSAVGGGVQAAGGPTVYGGGSTYNTTIVNGTSRGTTGYNSASSSMSYMGGRSVNSSAYSDGGRTAN